MLWLIGFQCKHLFLETTYLSMIGTIQIVGHGGIFCCQGVNLIKAREKMDKEDKIVSIIQTLVTPAVSFYTEQVQLVVVVVQNSTITSLAHLATTSCVHSLLQMQNCINHNNHAES